MDAQLLVCVKRERKKFQYEDYTTEDHLLMLVGRGSFLLETEGCRETVNAGEAAWFRPGAQYRRVILEPAELFLFRFRAEGALYPGHRIRFRDRGRIASTMELLRQLDAHPQPQDFRLRSALFQDILTQLTIEWGQPLFDDSADPMITDAVSRMNQTLHQHLPLPQFAARYGISYVQFCRRFKAIMGSTPTGFLQALRLQKARTMLVETDLAVYRIAAECGFENEFYFSRFFKKRCGLSPAAYRREAAGEKRMPG